MECDETYTFDKNNVFKKFKFKDVGKVEYDKECLKQYFTERLKEEGANDGDLRLLEDTDMGNTVFENENDEAENDLNIEKVEINVDVEEKENEEINSNDI